MIVQDVAANVVLMFVLMTLADDWDSVNGTENNAPVTYDEKCDGIEKT